MKDQPRFTGRTSVRLDKDERYWYLTQMAGDHSLRLRITHTCDWDPNQIAFEICVGENLEFMLLKTSLVAPIEWLEDDIPPDVVRDLPDVWRAEFVALVRRWAQITDIAMLAPSLGAFVEWT